MIDNIQGFHIEPTNICTLKCAGCARTRFINQWPQHWKNHSLDIDQLLKFLDVDLTNKKIILCGNYGDPIYHPDFINFVSKLKKLKTKITIVTNGSHRSKSWWDQLTNLLDETDLVRFSIDGLPENFTNYRKNGDWESILHGINQCAKSSCKTEWKYIPFSYNQENIEQAKLLSQQLGIDIFTLSPSDRFDEQTMELMPTLPELIGNKFSSQKNWKNNITITQVEPKCNSGNEHFISSAGYYSPCCYLSDHRFYYKSQFGKNKSLYKITETSLSQILKLSTVIDFYQNLNQHSACQFNCPKNTIDQ